MSTLTDDLRLWAGRSRAQIDALTVAPSLEQIGRVEQIGDGVAIVSGLPETRLDEILAFEGGLRGLAVDLGDSRIGCILLGDAGGVRAGSIVHGTGNVARAPVGEALPGREIGRAHV